MRASGWMVLAFLGIIALTPLFVVYRPSLAHIARSDQVSYLSATALNTDWYSAALGTYDLNRKPWMSKGDGLLFRPVLYFLLGCEHYFFEYDYWRWQLCGMLLHMICAVLLWRVLVNITGQFAAFVIAVFFAFQFVHIEAVTWHHINGYILFLIFVLLALKRYCLYLREGKSSSHIGWIGLWLTLACFTYEAGVWYSVCFAAAARRWRLLYPVFLYLVCSAINACYNNITVDAAAAGALHHRVGVPSLVLLIKWFLSAGLYLAPADLIFAPRLAMKPELLGWAISGSSMLKMALAAIFIALLIAVLVRPRQRGPSQGILPLTLWMLGGYTAMIFLGRVAGRGINDGLGNTLYYQYNFWALALIVLALLLKHFRGLKIVILTVLLALTVLNGIDIYRMNTFMANAFTQEREFVRYLREFVAGHRQEPGFSFSVADNVPGHYFQMVMLEGGGKKKITFAQLLYPQYYNDRAPKYIIGGR